MDIPPVAHDALIIEREIDRGPNGVRYRGLLSGRPVEAWVRCKKSLLRARMPKPDTHPHRSTVPRVCLA
jgi:hypothetical protein